MMGRYRPAVVALFALGTAIAPGAANEAQNRTLIVPSVRFPTIQQAIANAWIRGDTVLVAPGRYRENIDFLGKAITVRATQGTAAGSSSSAAK